MRGRGLFSRILLAHLAAALAGLALLAWLLDLTLKRWNVSAPQQLEARRLVAIGAVAIGLLLLATSAFLVRALRRALREVSVEAGRLGRGSAAPGNARPMTREIRELSEAINDMAKELAGVIDQLRSETALREQILASMREGVILSDPSTGLIYANRAAAQMFGRESIDQLPPQLDGEGERELTVYHPVRRELRSTSVKLKDGRSLIVIQDETARKRTEAIRTDFVANASHELKTPVAGILVTAETLEQAIREDPKSARRFARNLVEEVRRLGRLVQDLLDLARLEQGRGRPEHVQLAPIVGKQIDEVRERAQSKGLQLESRLDDECATLGIEEDLALLARNLLENAVGYTAQGRIEVSLSSVGEWVQLTISDTGVGIPTVDLDRIFERFYRVDKARSRDTGGTGLGLSIVRHVAESHGGVVEVTSELGHGSTFVVRLPSAPLLSNQPD